MLVASNTSPISNLAIIGRLDPARPLLDLKVARLLATTLDPGEAEAIALALELSADLTLLDERDGRSAAEQAGLRVTGVLGVLPRAKRDGAIEALEPEIAALRNHARFFVSKRLQEEVLKIPGE